MLEIKEESGIVKIYLNRPEAHNALSPEMIEGLTKVFSTIKKDLKTRAVLLRGNGPSFCAGGDLNWMRKSLDFTLAQNMRDTQKLSNMYEAIFQCPVPVLALVHGSVMGGGVGLTAVCDIVAAEIETRFSFSEVKLGLVPSIISPYALRKVHESAARALMLTAEIFKGPHAYEIGLVNFAGNQKDCEDYIATKLALISKNAPEATRITKSLIQKVKNVSWESARKLSVKTIAQRRVSKEGQEGMNAFFEKRAPSWTK